MTIGDGVLMAIVAVAMWELGRYFYNEEIAKPKKEKEEEYRNLRDQVYKLSCAVNVSNHIVRDTACHLFMLTRDEVEDKRGELNARLIVDTYGKLLDEANKLEKEKLEEKK